MDERWQEIERIYHAARELDGSERATFLAKACAGDAVLRSQVELMLAQAERAADFLETPAIEVAAEVIAKERQWPHPPKATLEIERMIAHYQLAGKIGEGGMGKVYRARDTKLHRDVALKVLPEAMARDAQRMARFEREARMLASLNHPNIAAIHGIEESNGVRALVMELVEGETLEAKINGEGSALPREPKGLHCQDALPIARQIAEALEYAHERGVIHRDLKPANIKITSEGAVKVLDFGLAKVLTPSDPSATGDTAESPGLTTIATMPGTLLGTAAYMSPEQAKGYRVDRRCDVWAFGCVLYEMLSGRKAFQGETISDVLAAVITKEPDWALLPKSTPLPIQRLIYRCLQKDLRQRLQAIGDARVVIEETMAGVEAGDAIFGERSTTAIPEGRRPRVQRALPWAVGILIGATLAGLTVWRALNSPTPALQAISASIDAPAGSSFRFVGFESGFALSPDGQRLAYIAANREGRTALWVRPLDSPIAQPLQGTEGAASPFWSPDSKFIGFFSGGQLKKVEASGGSPATICEASLFRGIGGTWSQEGDILFGSWSDHPIYRVSEKGGTPVAVTQLDTARKERTHRWPYFLPDGRHFLYFGGDPYAPPESGINGIFAASLDSKQTKFLVQANSGAAYASGYLLFLQGATLMAQRFDLQRLKLEGDAFPLAEGVLFNDLFSKGQFSVSNNGLVAYASSSQGSGLKLELFDRSGKRLGAVPDKNAYCCVQFSPDGRKVAYDAISGGKRDLWVYDFVRNTKIRLTFGIQNVGTSTWSPDGRHIIFSSNRDGLFGLYEKAADGSGAEETVLPPSEGAKFPWSWSQDGKYVSYLYFSPAAGAHLWILPLAGDRKPFRFSQSPLSLSETVGYFSPDGKWLAYQSEAGQPEIYAAAFPGAESRYQISTNGGYGLKWGWDGKEIFYISLDNQLVAVPVTEAGQSLEIGTPHPLFNVDDYAMGSIFDVTADGRRLIVTTFDDQVARPITLLIHWPALLEKK